MRGMIQKTNIGILNLLKDPEKYVNNDNDIQLIAIPYEKLTGGLLRFMIGIDDNNKYYFVVEDEYVSKDEYPNENESLIEAFIRIFEENI